MEFLKKNFAVVLAFTLPIALIVIVALITYLPSLFLSTHYNFVYIACTDTTSSYSYNCNDYLQKRYRVVNNALVVETPEVIPDFDENGIPYPPLRKTYTDKNYTAHIFLHDTQKNESREITLEEAQALNLNSLLTSPDGVTVSSNYDRNSSDFFFIFGNSSSSYGYYLTKGNNKRKLNLINSTDDYYYRENFQFIGWVVPGRN